MAVTGEVPGIVDYCAQQVYNDDETQIALIDVATGERIAWRTTAKVGEGDDAKYLFYDLNGNQIEVGLNEEKTAYIYGDKTLDFETVYPACAQALIDAADENGWVKLTAEHLKNIQDAIAILHGHENVEAYAAEKGDYAYQEFEEMAFLGQYYDTMEYDGNVGFFGGKR